MDKKPKVDLFNKYKCEKKPFNKVETFKKNAQKGGEQFKYSLSDLPMWDNIVKLWKEGHNVLLYNIDSPKDVFHENFPAWLYAYPCIKKNWLWWVRIYLRERYMAQNLRQILEKNKQMKEPVIAIFVESFHWIHVKFLLTNPSKTKIWKYYFGRFREIDMKNIKGEVRKANTVFYKHWIKFHPRNKF
jgi:hypothetical protein